MEWVRIFMRRGAGCGELASVTQHKVIVTPQPFLFLISTVMQVAVVVVVIMQKQSCWCSKHRRIALNAIVVKVNQWLIIEHRIL